MCLCHVECIDWWVFLHIIWVSRCFLVICASIFKLPSLFIFSLFISLRFSFSLYSGDCSDSFPATSASDLCCVFLRYVSLFLSFFLFAIRYVFLISPFFLSFFFCNCCPFFFFWFVIGFSVSILLLIVFFLGVHGG